MVFRLHGAPFRAFGNVQCKSQSPFYVISMIRLRRPLIFVLIPQALLLGNYSFPNGAALALTELRRKAAMYSVGDSETDMVLRGVLEKIYPEKVALAASLCCATTSLLMSARI